MKAKVIPELDKLFAEVGTYSKSDEVKKLYEFIKKFPYIAPYNAMLVHIQKPGSIFVASASDWNLIYKRVVKSNARPLVILRPFGPVSFVFEYEDTEGDPLPENIVNSYKVNGEIDENIYCKLIKNMLFDGIRYNEANYGTSFAGKVVINNGIEYYYKRNDKLIEFKTLYEIVANNNHTMETKFATILHELGHVYCGHLGTPSNKMWSDRSRLSKNESEFEAESVCWLVCERNGVVNPSAIYLSHYLNNNQMIPNISVDAVLKATGFIESLMRCNKTPRKELITVLG